MSFQSWWIMAEYLLPFQRIIIFFFVFNKLFSCFVIQPIKVQIREEQVLESSPVQSSENTKSFYSLPSWAAGGTPLSSSNSPPLRIKNKDVTFEKTLAGTVSSELKGLLFCPCMLACRKVVTWRIIIIKAFDKGNIICRWWKILLCLKGIKPNFIKSPQCLITWWNNGNSVIDNNYYYLWLYLFLHACLSMWCTPICWLYYWL